MGRRTRQSGSAAVRDLVLLALFMAIIIVMAFTPIGYIDLPVIKATLIHVPVIVGSILLGPKKGAFLGLIFGATSLIKNTMAPSALSFAFSPLMPVPGVDRGSVWALVICFVPRILVGITPWLVYKIGRLFTRKAGAVGRSVLLAVAGCVGSLTNTILVMGLIYTLFKDAYAAVQDVPVSAVLSAVLGVVGTNGVMEMIAAAIITVGLCLPLIRILKLEPKIETAEEAAPREELDPAVPAEPVVPEKQNETAEPKEP